LLPVVQAMDNFFDYGQAVQEDNISW